MSRAAVAAVQVFPTYVRRALDGHENDSIAERAAIAWSAQFQQEAAQAARRLEKEIKRALNIEVEAVLDMFDTRDPRYSVGALVEGYTFALRDKTDDWRSEKITLCYIAATCAEKDCANELAPSVSSFVKFGRALSVAAEMGAGPNWKCDDHAKGKR